ncbi:MAG TPA: hypothetical protein VFB76_17740, partial [Candidatus Angelobacter sp.]|nr:hypothetical protein [Candidatus Angelobacter sp.]
MQIWPQNGWFLGLRRVLFTKSAFAVLAIVISVILIVDFISRPDPARLEWEQYSAYSAYLFNVSLNEAPLPVQCSTDPRYTGGNAYAEIQQYFVSDQTISALAQPSAFGGVVLRKMETPYVSTAVFNNFFNRNLETEKLTKSFSGPKAGRLEVVHALPDLSAAEHLTLEAKLSKVGFNRDFTWAMFYAETSCGGIRGKEYVYMNKAL